VVARTDVFKKFTPCTSSIRKNSTGHRHEFVKRHQVWMGDVSERTNSFLKREMCEAFRRE